MGIKTRMLCAGVLAVIAAGGVAVVNAGATSGGHFVFGSHHVGYTIEEGSEHRIHFLSAGGSEGERIGCETSGYHGTHKNTLATTTTNITVIPTWSNCYTTASPGTKFDIHENGCDLLFTVRPNPETNHNTIHMVCPAGKAIVLTHPNCEVTIPPQTPTGGAIYKTTVENGVHAITLELTAGLATQYHGGICIFLGTNQTSTMSGSATLTAKDIPTGSPTHITAT
jgi:hypothetical protein